jgi:hypothetical protein
MAQPRHGPSLVRRSDQGTRDYPYRYRLKNDDDDDDYYDRCELPPLKPLEDLHISQKRRK